MLIWTSKLSTGYTLYGFVLFIFTPTMLLALFSPGGTSWLETPGRF